MFCSLGSSAFLKIIFAQNLCRLAASLPLASQPPVQCSTGSITPRTTYMTYVSRYFTLLNFLHPNLQHSTSNFLSRILLHSFEELETCNLNHFHFPQLVCSGVQHFIKDGEEMVERTELQHTVRSTSQRSESYQTNELEPNTQYSCHLTSVAGKLESEPSTQVKFTTTPGSKWNDIIHSHL